MPKNANRSPRKHANRKMIMNSAAKCFDRVQTPPAPIVVTELQDLFRHPHRKIDRLVDLIRREPSLQVEPLNLEKFLTADGEENPGTESVR